METSLKSRGNRKNKCENSKNFKEKTFKRKKNNEIFKNIKIDNNRRKKKPIKNVMKNWNDKNIGIKE